MKSKEQAAKHEVTHVIFVVEAGFVFLCDSATKGDDDWHLTNTAVIRIWGTKRGLGEIALNGPTPDTVLDPCGNIYVPVGKVLARIPCVY